MDAAVVAASKARSKPIILADIADNPGGGAPSDSTFILRALLDAGVRNVALGLLYDPLAVKMCHEVGAGGRLQLRLGGKVSRFSGAPVDLSAEVVDVRRAARMRVVEGVDFPMGDTAWIRAQGIDIILSSQRLQMYAPDGFEHIGLDPETCQTLVIKSSNHFRAFFGSMVEEIIDVATPGAIQFDFENIPYRKLRKKRHPRDAIAGLSERFPRLRAVGPADA